jgi:hypothetical protein
MTREECVNLAKYVGDLFPQQRMGSTTGLAWHDVLGHLEFGECKRAAAAINARQPFVSPSEIIAEIASARSAARPHSNACRGEDHGDCRVSWCMCACHPRAVRSLAGPRPPAPARPALESGPRRFDPATLHVGREVG